MHRLGKVDFGERTSVLLEERYEDLQGIRTFLMGTKIAHTLSPFVLLGKITIQLVTYVYLVANSCQVYFFF